MMMFKAFAKKLFGLRYGRILRTVIICVIIYMGISSAGYEVAIAPRILYLMSAVVTAVMMWQGMTSSDTEDYIRNMMMMPFDRKAFLASYIGTLGIYVLLSKTLLVWALVFALTKFGLSVILCSLCAALCAVVMTGCFLAVRKRFLMITWIVAVIGSVFLIDKALIMICIFGVCILVSVLIFSGVDAYAFYDVFCNRGAGKSRVRGRKGGFVFTYLMRYMMTHKNYIINTMFMWAFGVAIPVFSFAVIGREDPEMSRMFVYLGYGLVVMNTPLCILVSCDPDLERGIRCLPKGGVSFFVPYGLFLFVNTCINCCPTRATGQAKDQ